VIVVSIYVNPLDGKPETLRDVKPGSTVKEALEKGGINASGYQIKVNGETADLNRTIQDDDVITLARQIDAGV
jgi:sulfur carrier protein ThiS